MKAITMKDYERFEKKALDYISDIPVHHNRKREEMYHKVLMEELRNAKPRTTGKIAFLLVDEGSNQGTSRYPKWIRKVEERTINPSYTTETEKSYCGYKKSRILAYVK